MACLSSVTLRALSADHRALVGAGDEKLTVAYNYDKNFESTAVNPNMLFFVKA